MTPSTMRAMVLPKFGAPLELREVPVPKIGPTDVLLRVLSEDSENPASSHDFGRDVIPNLLSRARVVAYNFVDMNAKDALYWRDVGTIDAYYDANMDLVSVSPEFNLYDERWPVRTGVLVDDGVAYFGAGVFPHETVYLYAVEAATGKVIWKNDTISQQDAGRNDLSPQGYLLATKEILFVPSGRSLAASFNRATGEYLVKPEPGWRGDAGGQIGGTQAFLADDFAGMRRVVHIAHVRSWLIKPAQREFPRRRASAAGSSRARRAAQAASPAGSAIRSWRISISTWARPAGSACTGTV